MKMPKYKEFRVGELFDGFTGDVDLQNRDIDGDGEFLVNSGVQNQGIKGRTSRPARIFPAGSITVDFFGNAYLRDFNYKMATHNHVFSLQEKRPICHDAKLYIVAALSKLSLAHSFNNMLTWTILQDVKITLPVTLSDEPDFEYMAERIRELEAERIRELEAERIRELEAYLIASGLSDAILTDEDKAVLAEFGEREFEFFRIGDLFEKLDVPYYGSGKRNSDVVDSRDAEHCVPVTTAKRGNNGICRWACKGAFKTYENVISVVTNGAVATGLVYYQPDEVSSLIDSYLLGLKADGMNERVGLFLACAMQKVLYPKYTRDNKAYWSCVQDDEIPLPATLDGTPDFAFMAAYVRATEKLAIQDAIRLKDDIIAATKNIVRV